MADTTYIDRMKNEYTELQNRITKLKTYINSPRALEIQEEKLELLVRQYQVMNEYLSILKARISLESYTDKIMNAGIVALLIVALTFLVTILLCELWDIIRDKTIYSNKLTKITNIIVDSICVFLILCLEIYFITIL